MVLAAHGLLEGKKATCYPSNAFRCEPSAVEETARFDSSGFKMFSEMIEDDVQYSYHLQVPRVRVVLDSRT